jgi:hypothetical protein
LHRIFFQFAQARSGFARVANFGIGSGEALYEAAGEGGDAAQVSQKIEGGALAGQNGPGTSSAAQEVALLFDDVAVLG